MPPRVREDPADVRILLRRAAEHQMRDGARRVGRVFDRARRDAGHHVAAAVGRQRVHVDHGLAAVELGIDRREGRIAEIFAVVARQQADAVGLERVEGVFDFLQAAVGVRRRDRREQAEAAGMIAHELGAVFVDLAAELAGFLVVAPPGAGLDLRQHRRSRCRSCPCRRATSAPTISARRPCACRAPRGAPAAGNDGGRRSWSSRSARARPGRRRCPRPSAAMPPARNFRRPSAGPVDAGVGAQQAQLENIGHRFLPRPSRLLNRARLNRCATLARIRNPGQGGLRTLSLASGAG